jgi:CheY-like chemotaxis protein
MAIRLRLLPQTASAKLIAVTGDGQEKDRERAKEAGFARHWVKPVDMTTLSSVLNELLLRRLFCFACNA